MPRLRFYDSRKDLSAGFSGRPTGVVGLELAISSLSCAVKHALSMAGATYRERNPIWTGASRWNELLVSRSRAVSSGEGEYCFT